MIEIIAGMVLFVVLMLVSIGVGMRLERKRVHPVVDIWKEP